MFEQPQRKKADRDFTLYLPKHHILKFSNSSKKQNSPNNLFTEKKFKLFRFGSPFWTWTKDPLVKTTVAKATRRKVLLVTFTSDIFLRKTQKLLSVLPSVAYLWMLRGLCSSIRRKAKKKAPLSRCVFLGSPFWTWTKDPLINSQVL